MISGNGPDYKNGPLHSTLELTGSGAYLGLHAGAAVVQKALLGTRQLAENGGRLAAKASLDLIGWGAGKALSHLKEDAPTRPVKINGMVVPPEIIDEVRALCDIDDESELNTRAGSATFRVIHGLGGEESSPPADLEARANRFIRVAEAAGVSKTKAKHITSLPSPGFVLDPSKH